MKNLLTPLIYRGLFGQGLSVEEVYLWQYKTTWGITKIKKGLDNLVKQGKIVHRGDYYFINNKIADVNKQVGFRFSAGRKLTLAYQAAKKLNINRNIVFIGVSGSVAAGFALPSDDIDLVFVTLSHTLWVARLLFYWQNPHLPKRQPGQTHQVKNLFCLNLWLENDQIRMPANIFFAHEILNMVPIWDPYDFYRVWLKENDWIKDMFPVLYKVKSGSNQRSKPLPTRGWLEYVINPLAYGLQRLYMWPKKTNEKISYHQAFFHTHDYKKVILKQLRLEV